MNLRSILALPAEPTGSVPQPGDVILNHSPIREARLTDDEFAALSFRVESPVRLDLREAP